MRESSVNKDPLHLGHVCAILSCYIYPSVLHPHQPKNTLVEILSVMVFIKTQIFNGTKNLF